MPQFAANLSWMYTELAFPDRFEAAARDGFKAVELLSPYSWPAAGLKALLNAHGLQLVLFNAPPGGALNSTSCRPCAFRSAFSPAAGQEYGDRSSTALKPSRAAASKRSGKASSVYIQLRLAAN